ncbi:hypothetical protein Q1695_014482 [Nippostrongylus brasiliensis]|nr:hypothetical protein Q1695_014482 [Nippostrongylus brasiliensis]
MGESPLEQCLSRSYEDWLSSSTSTCNSSSDDAEGLIYSLSDYLKSTYTARPNLTTVSEEQIRIFVGCVIVITNMLLLVFLNSRATMRRRYIFFTSVAIGDIFDGFYLVYPSINRLVEMASGTFDTDTSLWDCARKGYMVFRIFGTELVSITMLIMTSEKVLAVLFTVHYRRYATDRVRFCGALGCLVICLASLTTMFLTSYFDPRKVVQTDQYCGVSGSAVEGFATFHQFFNLSCQISAFLGSAFAFIVARNLTKQANAKEINSIKPIVVVSLISCVVISSSNIIYILKNVVKLDITKSQQNYVVTYSSAIFQVSKFALYILTGQEFRDCLRKVIKDKNCTETHPTQVFVKTMPSTIRTGQSGRL